MTGNRFILFYLLCLSPLMFSGFETTADLIPCRNIYVALPSPVEVRYETAESIRIEIGVPVNISSDMTFANVVWRAVEKKVRTIIEQRYPDMPKEQVDKEINSYKVTVEEAFTNAAKWGNERDLERNVRFLFDVRGDLIYIDVADESGYFCNPNSREILELRAKDGLDLALRGDSIRANRKGSDHDPDKGPDGEGGIGIMLAEGYVTASQHLPHYDAEGRIIGTRTVWVWDISSLNGHAD